MTKGIAAELNIPTVVSLYRQGTTIQEMARQTGASRERLAKILDEEGVRKKTTKRSPVSRRQKEKMNELHAQGFNRSEIARRMDLDNRTVSLHLTRAGKELGVKHRSPLDPAVFEAIGDAYCRGENIAGISRTLRLNRITVRKILREIGLRDERPIDRTGCLRRRYFQEITDEARAYWLGMLYADGNVYADKDISLCLAEEDVAIVEAFRDAVAPDYPIYHVLKKGPNQQDQKKVLFPCREIAGDLHAQGCPKRKSLILEYPAFLVGSPLEKHFLRGYVDGDGSVGYHDRPSGYRDFGLSLTSTLSFCTTAAATFERVLQIRPTIGDKKERTERGNHITKDLAFRGNQQVYRALKWLYGDATIYMERKRARLLEMEALGYPDYKGARPS